MGCGDVCLLNDEGYRAIEGSSGKLLITHLGEDYVSRMFATYAGCVPAEADLVCSWFEKAGKQIASG